jgi:DNA (cytosine-5)-methyltransferase 1
MRSIEICAGAGGQALGLEGAGFAHAALVELDPAACATLKANRPGWNVVEGDVKGFSASGLGEVDLLAGGVPCPPFSVAGRRLGADDGRDLFPEALRLAQECSPKAVMIENVEGLFAPRFDGYRAGVERRLKKMGYVPFWGKTDACLFGVPQHRVRTVLVALRPGYAGGFVWPEGDGGPPVTVGEALGREMAAGGWAGAAAGAGAADAPAPTLVGGSRLHGGPDLGPTRAREAWARLGVDGRTLAEAPPGKDHTGMPRLTPAMAAIVQGFPAGWAFSGRKTAAYRQIGNAFPPPVARAFGLAIAAALRPGAGGEEAAGGKAGGDADGAGAAKSAGDAKSAGTPLKPRAGAAGTGRRQGPAC